jgi:hypothetical protein
MQLEAFIAARREPKIPSGTMNATQVTVRTRDSQNRGSPLAPNGSPEKA